MIGSVLATFGCWPIVVLLPICSAFGTSSGSASRHWHIVLRQQNLQQPAHGLFLSNGNDGNDSSSNNKQKEPTKDDNDNNNDMFSLQNFQNAKESVQVGNDSNTIDYDNFDGYQLRNVIFEKWGKCFDVDFNPVDSFGFRSVYLNVMPCHLPPDSASDGEQRRRRRRGPFWHNTELDYLCHLQAVVEILQKYNQLEYILAQIQETTKKPWPGTSPLVAVPLQLDLTPEQVDQILN